MVLGPARSLNARHGGTAPHATLDSPTTAVLLRGGLRPQASVEPAERRAPRARLRRRLPLRRQRAERVAQAQQTDSQEHRPAIGPNRADQADRLGVAQRLADPAGPQRLAVA